MEVEKHRFSNSPVQNFNFPPRAFLLAPSQNLRTHSEKLDWIDIYLSIRCHQLSEFEKK